MSRFETDEVDQRILAEIKDHARLTYKEIGDRVGLSRVAVKNRMERMQSEGVIRGYQTICAEPEGIGGTRFMLDIETTPGDYSEMAAMLKENKMIRRICSVTGECRLHAEGIASNTRNLEHFANTIYNSGLGVRRLSCHTVLAELLDMDGGRMDEQYQDNEHMEK